MGLLLTALLSALAWLTWQDSLRATDTLWPHISLFAWAITLAITLHRSARRRAQEFWKGSNSRKRWAIATALSGCAALGGLGWIGPAWTAAFCITLQLWASLDRPQFAVPALALAVFIPAGLIEAALVWTSQSREAVRAPVWGKLARKTYLRFTPMFQFEPQCSAFDPELLYKIVPGGCTFEGAEFRVHIPGNSLGLPDDELSLEAPEVAFAGDSWTMGWGVQPDETFAARFEAKTGVRTATVAVASYGTARELTMLQRLDRSGLRRLYLQYHPNDEVENRTFVENGCSLEPHEREDHERWLAHYASYSRYWPGKAGAVLLRVGLIRLTSFGAAYWPFASKPSTEPKPAPSEVESFAGTLECFADMLEGVEVRVFSSRWLHMDTSEFLEVLQSEIPKRKAFESIDIQTLELEMFDSNEFFTLDTHPNAAGHAKIARQLVQDWQ